MQLQRCLLKNKYINYFFFQQLQKKNKNCEQLSIFINNKTKQRIKNNNIVAIRNYLTTNTNRNNTLKPRIITTTNIVNNNTKESITKLHYKTKNGLSIVPSSVISTNSSRSFHTTKNNNMSNTYQIPNGREQYQATYEKSMSPDYWAELASKNFHWETPFDKNNVLSYNFTKSKGPIFIKWFEDGETNICYNAVDRWAKQFPDKAAFIYEGNDGESLTLSFKELQDKVCQVANVLRDTCHVKKGDRVALYMPMSLELPITMLACARIGAIHSVVFGGFSAEALASRIIDCKADVLITADAVMRGTKVINLKSVADEAMDKCNDAIKHCVVLKRLGSKAPANCQTMKHGRDINFHDAMNQMSTTCPISWNNAEDPLFILYTSGSTGKPKGVLHTTGGYMVWTHTTFVNVFNYEGNPNDVFWCTADCGWITGHSYLTYGPLLAGCTSIVFEGVPTHPTPSRFWEVCEKHKVSQFYTAPTAIRSLMASGDEPVLKHDLSSLRILGTVGEPINPEAWNWYDRVVGKSKCPIVDTWWQTETVRKFYSPKLIKDILSLTHHSFIRYAPQGGHMLTPIPYMWELEPGSATLPFYGVEPALMDPTASTPTEVEEEGHLTFKRPWPGIMRTLWGDQERFEKVYFSEFDGYYTAGDGAKRDLNTGYLTITGRTDDVMVISGHNIGTAEVESAFVAHPNVAEAAVVGIPHPVKGSSIYAYVTLVDNIQGDSTVMGELKKAVSDEIGAFARPDTIHFTSGLPKTRSGKIMRRILRKIANEDSFKAVLNDRSELGDTSTLAEPEIVDELIVGRKNLASL